MQGSQDKGTQNVISSVRLALPKGHMQAEVLNLLKEANIQVHLGAREYRPSISLEGYSVKMLKPQNIVEMLHYGSRDLGFAGADWVKELGANLVELLDTGLDPVRIVSATSAQLLDENNNIKKKDLIIASEYQNLSLEWIKAKGLSATFVKSYGATEVFPPEDADVIIDNTATGSTLDANNLTIIDSIMSSSTRLYASPQALKNKHIRSKIDDFVLLIKSVVDARKRVMLEINVGKDNLESILKILPCMKEHTIAPLRGESGYAVKSAVLRSELARLIPKIKASGGTDIIVSNISQLLV